jgi:hypothetical protein
MLASFSPSFWDVIWFMFVFFAWVMWISVVINVFVDNLRRQDYSGFSKAMWTLLIVFLPVFGVLLYLIARPSTAATV